MCLVSVADALSFLLHPLLTCAGTKLRDEQDGTCIFPSSPDLPLLRLTDQQWLVQVVDVGIVRLCIGEVAIRFKHDATRYTSTSNMLYYEDVSASPSEQYTVLVYVMAHPVG